MKTDTCVECGNRLGESYAEYEDGCICLDCDRKYDPNFNVPYIGKDYYCTVCGQNVVDAANGFDTCKECLARQ